MAEINTQITEKSINTRIINRHDSLDNWNKDDSVLLKEGEIALAFVDAVKLDDQGKPVYDAKGKVLYVPTCVMKVGKNGEDLKPQKFSDLPFVSAPASDVYAWAKKKNLETVDLPSDFKQQVATLESYLTGIGGTGNPTTVLNAIIEAIESLNEPDPGDTDGTIVKKVSQEKGYIKVEKGYITDADIEDTAISMSKINGLTDLNNKITAPTTGLVDKVSAIEAQLSDVTTVMDFRGALENLPATTEGYQDGDVILVTSTGKEYVCSANAWVEFGHADFTDTAVGHINTALFGSGNTAETYTGGTIVTRISNLEYEIGETTDNDGHISLKDRVSAAEANISNIQSNYATSDNNECLVINNGVLIFDCGTSLPREYLGESSSTSTT